jgi:hypothetical protein
MALLEHLYKQEALQRFQDGMEPYRAASVPLYETYYQPRFWEKLTRAGLIHDDMLCYPKAALRIFEANTKAAKP